MEVRDYIIPLLKWWWLILVAVIVSGFTSVVVTSQQPLQYEAKATLMIGSAIEDPNPTNYQLVAGQQLATTYADIANREPVRKGAAQALGLPRLPKYTVRPVPNTNLLEIIVIDEIPERAAAVANELANQIILASPTSPQSEEQQRLLFIKEQLDELEIKIRETQDEILQKQEELANLTSALEIQDAQQQITALQSKANTLQSNYATLLANTQTNAINTLSVIEPATPPLGPVGPNVPLMAATAAGIGFLLAASAAYLLEYLDNTVKTPDDIARLTNLPMLTGIAYIKSEGKSDKGEEYTNKLVTINQPRAPVSEAYRKLRTAIQFASIDSPNKTSLLITSTNPGEGKSVTAANLAVVMAQAGNRVLLVDADLRRPSQHNIFELPNSRGLTSLLLKINSQNPNGEVDQVMTALMHQSPVDNLFIMTSGPIPPNPSELLGSSKMHQTIDLLTSRFDYVVIDSPPVIAVTDAVVLSTLVDSVVVVTEAGRTQRTPLRQSVNQLREVKANLVGVVLNRLPSRGPDGYYYYYYRNSYYLEDGADAGGSNTGGRGGLLQNLLPRKNKETTIGE